MSKNYVNYIKDSAAGKGRPYSRCPKAAESLIFAVDLQSVWAGAEGMLAGIQRRKRNWQAVRLVRCLRKEILGFSGEDGRNNRKEVR